MILSYRGLKYNSYANFLTTVDSGIIGKYRGNTYRIQQRIAVPSQPYELQYRGVAYSKLC